MKPQAKTNLTDTESNELQAQTNPIESNERNICAAHFITSCNQRDCARFTGYLKAP